SRFAPGAVLLQQKPNHSAEPVGAPAPGANGACPGRYVVPASFAVRTEAVLLQQNQTCPRTRRSTRPGCEWVPTRAQIRARFVRGSHRGRCSYRKKPKPAAAP